MHRFALAAACVGALVATPARAEFLDDLACPLFGCPAGPPSRVELSCRSLGLDGAPQFKSSTPGSVTYRFRGVCASADQRKSVAYVVDASWTPSETDPDRPNVSEIFRIAANDTLSPDHRPEAGSVHVEHVIFGAHCDRDPWLQSAHCARIGDTLPDRLHRTWPDIATAEVPNTRNAIPPAQRAQLRTQYAAAHRETDRLRAGPTSSYGAASTIGPRDRTKAGWEALSTETLSGTSAIPKQLETRAVRHSSAVAQETVASSESDKRYGHPYALSRQNATADQAISLHDLSQAEKSVRVEVRYPTAYGYKHASGLFDPAPNSCDAFYISALPASGARPRELIRIAPDAHMRSSGGMYVCEYVVSELPFDELFASRVAVSDEHGAASETWLGGSQPRPGRGQRRSIANGVRQVALSARQTHASLQFEMTYAGSP